MKTPRQFLFVPGSFHGAWCWYKMQPLLSRDGCTSMAIDLPGHGKDNLSPHEVTLEHYVDAVCHALESLPGKVTLIGHSRAGIVISSVAERMPQKLECLVYLCAFLIPSGEPMVATALADSESLLVSNLIFNEQEGWHIPADAIVKDAFFNDCPEEDVALARFLLCREPNAPVGTPLNLTPDAYGSVPRVYVQCTLDHTISPAMQQRMVEREGVSQLLQLPSGHSPFLSRPRELADLLLNL